MSEYSYIQGQMMETLFRHSVHCFMCNNSKRGGNVTGCGCTVTDTVMAVSQLSALASYCTITVTGLGSGEEGGVGGWAAACWSGKSAHWSALAQDINPKVMIFTCECLHERLPSFVRRAVHLCRNHDRVHVCSRACVAPQLMTCSSFFSQWTQGSHEPVQEKCHHQ